MSIKTLRRGDRGAGVDEVQKMLNGIGEKLRTMGVFDVHTQEAVERHQQYAGLPLTGQADQFTVANLRQRYAAVIQGSGASKVEPVRTDRTEVVDHESRDARRKRMQQTTTG